MKQSSIRRDFLANAILFGVLIMAAFCVYHLVTVRLVRTASEENLDFMQYQIVSATQEAYAELDETASLLLNSRYVIEFLSEPVSTRYDKGVPVHEAINSISYRVPLLDAVLLFDTQGSCYRYGSGSSVGISNQRCQQLFARYKDNTNRTAYSLITVEDRPYFCTSYPVYAVEGRHLKKVGMAILLSSVQKSRELFNSYNQFSEIAVCLVNQGGEVLISNVPELEGQRVSQLPLLSEKVSYLQTAEIAGTELHIVLALEKTKLLRYNNIFVAAILIVMGVAALLFLSSTWVTNHRIVGPISEIIGQMRTLGSDTLRERLAVNTGGDIGRLAQDINALLDRTEDFSRRVFTGQQTLYEAEIKKQQMQIYLLRRQINAHFIFNALNSILSLATSRGDEDVAMIAGGLATLVRYSYNEEEFIEIFEELSIIQQYVNIVNVRFPGRFTVNFEVDDQLCGYTMLKQVLQPIIENAMLHGLEAKAGHGQLDVTGALCGGKAVFVVRDNGVGIAPDQLEKLRARLQSSEEDHSLSGIALVNIGHRIRFYYGQEGGLDITSTLNQGTTVTLQLPLREEQPPGQLST